MEPSDAGHRLWPTFGPRAREHAGRILDLGVALGALLSMWPYFTWRQPTAWIGAGQIAVAGCLALVLVVGGIPRLDPLRLPAALGIGAFLVYATVLPGLQGHHRWVFVLPTVAALGLAGRQRALGYFERIFALSLVPGVLVSAAMVLGFDLDFSVLPHRNPVFAAAGTQVLQLPGAVFTATNSVLLPWGGVLSRLCGPFDEPGMVGTVAALLLGTRGFCMKTPLALWLLLCGVLSFSLAFAVLASLGLLVASFLHRRPRWLLLAALPVWAGATAIGVIPLPSSGVAKSPLQRTVEAAAEPISPAPHPPLSPLRQSSRINNRNSADMEELVRTYWRGDFNTLVFGIASDASSGARSSAAWTRVLTDFGLLGLALLLGPLVWRAARAYGRSTRRGELLLFVALFLLSFAQRSMIWLPYPLLIYFLGLDRLTLPRPPIPSHAAPTP